jgi:hypothetical protein
MPWPELTVAEWEPTRDAVHLWSQVVGKIRLALVPFVNHWWNSTLYVSARGLTTSLMPAPDGGVEVELDFVDHVLALRHTDGRIRSFPLQPMSVADFHRRALDELAALGVEVSIYDHPVELRVAIPFHADTDVRPYDRDAIHRFWLALVEVDRLFRQFRGGFIGKASPVHFFWGAFDLAVTRFSGRLAPLHRGGAPNCPDWVMFEAYSHEVSSAGFWPGGSDEGSFYAYAYPEPDGFAAWPMPIDEAHYDAELGEFILPYRAVRTADDPDAMVLAFLEATYEAAAVNAEWDRAALEL